MQNRTILQSGIAALASVLLMSWLRIRPLGIILLTLFGIWLYWTRSNVRIVPPPELQRKYAQLKQRIFWLRLQRPAMFCAVASVYLLVLAMIGHLISGLTVVLVGLVLATLLAMTKYSFKLVKIDPNDLTWSEQLNYNESESDDDYDEFMPELNEANLLVLESASLADKYDDEDDTSDEIPTEFLPTDVMPDIEEYF